MSRNDTFRAEIAILNALKWIFLCARDVRECLKRNFERARVVRDGLKLYF